MKRIVIIGASSGLGRRVATDFARLGMRVGIAARREDLLRKVRDEYPDQIEYETIDVTAPDAVERFYNLIERLGGMDTLLYASGTGWKNPSLDPAKEDLTIGVNVTGFTRIVIAAYKYFRDTANVHPGQIAVITSVGATKGLGVSAAYSATKRYQQTYLQALDQLAHMQHVNVDITDIRPGFIDTDLLEPGHKYPLEMSVDYAARRIELAILRRRRIAYIDSRWAVVVGLWRAIPGCLWRHLQIDI